MNICIVGEDLNPPLVEATRLLAHELSKQLAKAGHLVYIISGASPGLPSEEATDGVNFYRVRKDLFALNAAMKIREIHKDCALDMIHLQNMAIYKSHSLITTLCRKLTSIPVTSYVCQLPLTPDSWTYIVKHDIKEALSKLSMLTPMGFIRLQLRHENRVVTSSMFLKKTLENVVNSEFNVIPPFMSSQRFEKIGKRNFRKEFGIEKEEPLLLYVGAHRAFRNEEDFLACFSILLKDFPSAKAFFVTTLPIADSIDKLVARLGIEKSIFPLSRDKVIDIMGLMSAADVYVYPAFSSLGSIDPPLTIIEAKLLGIPVVAYNVGGVSEVIDNGKTGLLVRPSDYRGMAEAIANVLDGNLRRANTYKQKSWRARWLGSSFDSRLAARRFTSIYEEITRN